MKNREHGRRKAAILLASLDRDSAESLLAELSSEQAQTVRQAMAALADLDLQEQGDVLEEFFRIGPLVPDRQPPGLELDDAVAMRISLDARAQGCESEPATDEPASLFRVLKETPIKNLSSLLEREHPQTIAVVVSHLAPARAAELLAGLPSALQAEVARRLVDLDETAADVLREVERGLEAWLSEHSLEKRRHAGMAALKEILSAADPDVKENILANVCAHDRQLAVKLAPAVASARGFSFADLAQLDDQALAKVLRAADRQTTVLALAAASDELVERVLNGLPSREEKDFRYALDHLGTIRLSDLEEAQQELAAIAQSLEASGQIKRLPCRLSVAA